LAVLPATFPRSRAKERYAAPQRGQAELVLVATGNGSIFRGTEPTAWPL